VLDQTVGVAIFVLRRTARHETEVLLLRRARGGLRGQWSPVAGALEPEEREAEAALRELAEETSLDPDRLYAVPFSGRADDPDLGATGRIGLFVAWMDGDAEIRLDAENDRFEWCPLREAETRLPLAEQRRVLSRVAAEFVRRPPDESLRIV
jgi:8-oxo-dGTP pyrophosphatase MutT (NUDIX family)